MSWLSIKLLGLRRLLFGDDFLPERPAISFSGLTVVDNPSENRTDVTCEATAIVDAATNLATPETLVLRAVDGGASFDGVSVFEALQVEGAGGITTTALNATEEALFEQGLTSDAAVKAPTHTLAADVIETRVQAGAMCPTAGDWYTNDEGELVNITVATAVVVPLDIPHGARLTSVTARYKGPTGHLAFPAGAPASMPYAEVCYYSITSGAQMILDVLDASASVAVYEAEHDLTVAPMTHIVDREDRRYSLRITAEGGANALIAGKVLYVTATWTRLADSAVGHD